MGRDTDETRASTPPYIDCAVSILVGFCDDQVQLRPRQAQLGVLHDRRQLFRGQESLCTEQRNTDVLRV